MAPFDRLSPDDPLVLAVGIVIILALVAAVLLLVTARLPSATAATALGWVTAAVAVTAWSAGRGETTRTGTDATDFAFILVAIAGVALLGLILWDWRAGGLLGPAERPPRPVPNARTPVEISPESRHQPDPALALGRHQLDLRSAYDNLSRGQTRSAIRDAGPVLEDVIDSWLKRGLGVREVPDDMTMPERISRVAAMGHLTAQQRGQVSRWWALRNRASHELGPIARAEAHDMVDGVTRLAARLAKR